MVNEVDLSSDDLLLLTNRMNYEKLSEEEEIERVFYRCRDEPLETEFIREGKLCNLLIKNGCSCRFQNLLRIFTPDENTETNDEIDDEFNRYFKKVPEDFLIDVVELEGGIKILRFTERNKSEYAFLGFNERTNELVFTSLSLNALKRFFAFFMSSYEGMSEDDLKYFDEGFESFIVE